MKYSLILLTMLVSFSITANAGTNKNYVHANKVSHTSRHVSKKHIKMRTLKPTSASNPFVGIGSWYGYESVKKRKPRTASGEIFNPKNMTAAHRHLPFGTKVEVTNLANNQSVIVVINDRGPFVRGRIIDLSKSAARSIGMYGTQRVSLNIKS